MTSLILGHTPPPLKGNLADPDDPFFRYSGVRPDGILAQGLEDAAPAASSRTRTARIPMRFVPPGSVPRTAADGLLVPDSEYQLRAWQSDVRKILFVSELTSLLHFVRPGFVAGAPVSAGLFMKLSTPEPLVALTRPGKAVLEGPGGVGAVLAARSSRANHMAEILSQVGALDIFFATVTGLHPERHPMTVELLSVVSSVIAVPVQQFKHEFCAPRPAELSPDVRPIILTPGHGSYPGGHAAYAFALAVVLAAVTSADSGTQAALLYAAEQVAENRVRAGLHYPCDSGAGTVIGLVLGQWLTSLGTASAAGLAWSAQHYEGDTGAITPVPAVNPALLAAASAIDLAPKFVWLWQQASSEWS